MEATKSTNKSTVTSVRIPDAALEWLKEYAAFNGVSTTRMINDLILEKMEEDLDYQDAIKSIKESEGKPTYTLEEIMEKYC